VRLLSHDSPLLLAAAEKRPILLPLFRRALLGSKSIGTRSRGARTPCCASASATLAATRSAAATRDARPRPPKVRVRFWLRKTPGTIGARAQPLPARPFINKKHCATNSMSSRAARRSLRLALRIGDRAAQHLFDVLWPHASACTSACAKHSCAFCRINPSRARLLRDDILTCAPGACALNPMNFVSARQP